MKGRHEKVTSDYLISDNKINLSNINSAVVIPVLNPEPNLIGFVHELIEHGISQIVVVNDGSDPLFDKVFYDIEQLECCTVLHHTENHGKGRALKTAFSYFMEHFTYLDGVITADADGQHTVEDILKISKKMSDERGALILGIRDFNKMPKRSYIGNMVSSCIFKLFYGSNLNDTQTGLRGIPSSELAWMIDINGERYDYEINMLIKARRRKLNFLTVPIKTLYFDNNSGTHYRTLKDSILISIRLMSELIHFSSLTIISGIIDITVFFLLNSIVFATLIAPVRILISTVVARIFSSICNYLLNMNIIFANTGKLVSTAVRYYFLLIFLILSSYILVYTISLFWRVNESIIKLIVDIGLGFVSYQIQLRWVFKNNDSTNCYI